MQAAVSPNIQMEAGLLGSLILDHEDTRGILPRLAQTDFSVPLHQKIFLAVDTLTKTGKPVDSLNVNMLLIERFKEDHFDYLCSVVDARCVPSFASFYADKIKQQRAEELLLNAESLMDQGRSKESILAQIRRLTEPQIEAEEIEPAKTFKSFTIGDVAKNVLSEWWEQQAQPWTLRGVPSGFKELDAETGGFLPGEQIVLTGYTGEGKTILAMNMAMHITGYYELPALYICLEMSKEALTRRFIATKSGASTRSMRLGVVREELHNAIETAALSASDYKLELADQECGIKTPADIGAYVNQMAVRPVIVFLDHLGLLQSGTGETDPIKRNALVSTAVKQLAVSLHIPIVSLCQVRRPDLPKNRKPPKICLFDMKNSGNIEQDANLVLAINRPGRWDKEKSAGEAQILILKQREGEEKEIEVTYDAERSEFSSQTKAMMDLFKPRAPTPPDTPPVQDAQGVIDCSPEPAQQADEQIMSFEPEETEVEKVNAERREKEDGSVVWQTKTASAYGPEHKVWSHESCELKVRKAIRDGSITDLFTKSAAWLGGFLNGGADDAEVSWAAECSERLGEVYDRVMKEIAEEKTTMFPRNDIDLSAFGF